MADKKASQRYLDGDDSALRLAEATLDSAREPIFRIRRDGNVDFVNLAACEALGYSREELGALGVSDIDVDFPPEKLVVLWSALREAGALEVEGRHRRKDGSEFPVALDIRSLVHEGKEFALVSARDISAEKDMRSALDHSEARLRSVRRYAGIGFAESRPGGDKLVWDENTFRIFGYAPGEFEPTVELLLRHVVPEDHPILDAELRGDLGNKEGFDSDYRIVTVDGRHRHIHEEVAITRDDGGNVKLLTALVRDVTESKEAEAKRRESEARLREAQSLAHMGHWRLDLETDEVTYSDEVYEILGVPRDSFGASRKNYEALIHPDDRIAFEIDVVERRFSAETLRFDHRIVRPDGRIIWVEQRAAPILDAAGKVVGMSGVVQDVTEFKETALALQENEARLREAQRIARMGEWHRDLRTDELVYSDEIYEILGVTRETFKPSPRALAELVHPDDREFFKNIALNRIYEPEAFSYSHRILRPDGGVIHVEQRSEPILDDSGNVVARHGTIQDISELKKVTQALQESEAEFSQAQAIAHIGSWYRDLVTGELTYSDEMFRILGVDKGSFKVTPKTFMALLHPDDHDHVNEMSQIDPSQPQDFYYEHRIVRPDGAVRYIDHHSRPVFDATGKVIARRGTMQDITERKEAEIALGLAQHSLDAAREAIFRFGIDGRVLYANPEACRSLGYSEEEILKLSVPDINADVTADALQAQWGELRAVGVLNMECRHRRKDGGLFPVSSTVSYVKQGDAEYSFVSARDISDRKIAEERLAQTEQRFALARRSARIGVWEWGIETGSAEWSDETFLIYGHEPGSFQPTYEIFESRVHPDDREALHAAEREAFESGAEYYECEFRVVMPDGEVKHVFDCGVISRDQNGAVDYMTGIVQDISRRKRAEQAVAESERLYRNILDNMRDTYYRADLEGRLVMASRSAEALTGYSMDELIGKQMADLYARPGERERFLELLAEAGGEVTGYEYEMQRKDGGKAWLSANVRNWRDADGKVLGVEGTARDVTAARDVAEQLRQAQKMEAVGQLTGGIAHDFNNLLTVVIGNLDLLAGDTPDGTPQRDMISRAYAAAERGAHLTHRMLAFSRNQSLSPSVIDLNEVIENIGDMLRVTLGESVEISSRLFGDLWPCRVDRPQLENSILNLAINSRDAMPDGGRFEIAAENIHLDAAQAEAYENVEAGDYVMFSATDTGSGIPRDVIERVFDPFFSTKDVGSGSGLGLSMIYGFAKQSGGHVTIESAEGKGTTVKHYLPRWVP